MKVDYLIIGQGLAGTMMAYHLMEAGKSVCVVDNGLPSASSVAAGLFNPVTGRRFVKSWLIEQLLPYADEIYPKLEDKLGEKLYYKKPIIRMLAGNEEKAVYDRSLTDENRVYIKEFHGSDSDNAYASCEILEGGYVDTSLLISSFRKVLQEQNSFKLDDIEYEDLTINEDGITWKNVEARGVIFCEGYKAIVNTFFPGLPFNLAKGEILTLKIPGLNVDKILMSGAYLVPQGEDIYKLGSTYIWDDLTPVITDKGKEELVAKLKGITNLPFEILNQEAGIRPTIKNRRPIVGQHAKYSNLFILNGMGTKGVLLAPYFAKQLSECILEGKPVDKEVDVQQYMKD